MKKILTALVFSGVLFTAACTVPETPQQIVFASTSTYAGLAATAGVYESLPRCDETEEKVCSERDIVEKVRKADEAAFSSLDTAQDIVRDEDGVFSGATKEATANSLKEVIQNFKNLLVEFGVLKEEGVAQ